MEHKPCSFKSYCIKPWICSITELQNGNERGGGKNASSSQSALPQLFSRIGSGQPIPHTFPAQRRRQYRWAGHRTLALRLRPHPATKVKGDRFLSQPRSPGSRCQSLRPGWGQLCSRSPLPLGTCPARPVPDPAPAPHTVAWSPLTSGGHGSGSHSEAGGRRESRRAWGGEDPETRTRARAYPSPGRAHASRRTPARLTGSGQPGGQLRICRARRCDS